jgi:aspartyl-tRNA(Asn)/glutamyl-tRNA(Gln) amidotransferase subunit C
MSVDKATVARIATLARIEIRDDELEPLAGELSRILGWIEQLREVDTDRVEPMTGVTDIAPRMRADEVTDGDRPDDILAGAPERHDGFFVVPKVVE